MFTEFTLDAVITIFVHSIPSHPAPLRYILVLSQPYIMAVSFLTKILNASFMFSMCAACPTHLYSFLTKILYASFMFSMCATCPTHLYLIVLTVWSELYTLLDSYIVSYSVNFHSLRSKYFSQHFIFKLHKSISEYFWWWYITVNMAVIFGHSHCLGFFQATNPIS